MSSLETEHRRHHTEPTPHPDEPQPIKWTGRRAEVWTDKRRMIDKHPKPNGPTGMHRKPLGKHAAQWTLERAKGDNESRNPWRAMRKKVLRIRTDCKQCHQKELSA